MLEFINTKIAQNAIAVSLKLPDQSDFALNNSLNELVFLAKTLGIAVSQTFTQSRNKIDSSYYIGKGKLEEIKKYIENDAINKIDTILFDNELTGVQVRNLEKFFDKNVFGRTEIILNIFNQRAKTKEAKLQVRLASLEYMMPRLRNMWTHFSRVQGGIGVRGGEGEKQLELDKRIVQHEIHKIKKQLKKIDIQMKNRSKNRQNQMQVSLVGYTNAGKSTLFNLMAKSEVFTENMLFATLDNTIRKVYIHDQLTILLNDTVGFISKLPHTLVASFKSTLDEIKNSKLLLHLVDISNPNYDENIQTVNLILHEIKADHIPCIMVFNKIDMLNQDQFDELSYREINPVLISAINNKGIEELKTRISDFLTNDKN